jgi:hypothetical protein
MELPLQIDKNNNQKANGFTFVVLLLTASLTFSPQASSTKKDPSPLFEQKDLVLPFRITHPVTAIDLADVPGKELLVMGIDKDKHRMLAIYAQTSEGDFSLYDQAIIPTTFIAYDHSELEPPNSVDAIEPSAQRHKSLYFLSNNGVYQYQLKAQLEGEQFIKLASVNSIYLQEQANYLSQLDFVTDLTGDGRDDIYLQDFQQVNILIGQADGNFIAQAMPIKAKMTYERNLMMYGETPYAISDINLDNKPDLVFPQSGELNYFVQNENGQFELSASKLSIAKSIEPLDWWYVKDEEGNDLDQSELDYRKFSQLLDVNGDGISDMVIRYTQSSGVLDRVNDYEVYLGRNEKGRLVFKDKADSVIKADGTLANIDFEDINNDGKLEVLVSSFDIGLSQIISALLAGSVDQDVLVFSMDENEQYGEDAAISKEVELTFSLSSGRSGEPVVRLDDITGDGFKDLLLSSGSKSLKLYPGIGDDNLFSRRAIKQKVTLPKDGEMVFSDDLNLDGKTDLIMRYGHQDDAELRQTVTLLIAK